MKIKTIMGSVALALILAASPAMAVTGNAPAPSGNEEHAKQNKGHLRGKDFFEDPIGMLEGRKQEIQKLLKDKKISADRAREWTEILDAKIADLKAFDRLTLQEKKAKLIADCKNKLDKLVAAGRMTKEKADSMLKAYSEKIGQWEGSGYPFFSGMRHHLH